MRFRNTIILLLLLAGLGAYVYFVEVPEARKESEKKTIVDFKADDATKLALAYPDREIVVEKKDGVWKLTKPLEAPADDTSVKSLLTTIAGAEVKKTLDEKPTDLASFGLAPPSTTIRVSVGDKELPAIKVGNAAPVGGTAYVQRDDEPKILLTNSVFRSSVDKKMKDLREKSILQFADADVHKLEIKGADKDIVLVKKDDDWRIESPAAYDADDGVVHSYIASLRALRALDFPDDNPKDLATYGLDSPRLTVTAWVGASNDQRQIQFGKQNDQNQVFVKTSSGPSVYAIGEWAYRDMDKGLPDLRDKTVLAFDAAKVTAVEVHRADGSHFKLTLANGKWTVEGAEGPPADGKITQFVKDLHDVKGYEIAADHPADLAPFGLQPPSLSFTLYGEGGKSLGAILMGQRQAEKTKQYTAMLAGGDTVVLIRDFLYTRVDKTARDFVELPTPTAGPTMPGGTPTLTALHPGEAPPDQAGFGDDDVGGDDQDNGADQNNGADE